MATHADVTVCEYGSIKDAIEVRIPDREFLVAIKYLRKETGISALNIEGVMAHMTQKYEHISQRDIGGWEFELPG